MQRGEGIALLRGGILGLASLVLLPLSKRCLEPAPNGLYDALTIRHWKGSFLVQMIDVENRYFRAATS